MAGAEETTDDAFLGGALRVLQPKDGYRAGMDAVLLAAAASGKPRVLDVGAGVGVVGMAVARRIAQAQVMLVERDPLLAALARINIARNDLGGRVRVVEADILRPLGELAELHGLAETFDQVLANPPYHALGRGTHPRDRQKGAARVMASGDLERWFRFMAAMAKPGGRTSLVHRADALGEILRAGARRFGGFVIVPIHAKGGEAATRILVHATKGSRAPLTLLAGIVLHDADGRLQPQIEAVLRAGAALARAG
jgi:tRNA1(Val) A37 N6-methylase TrmN6